MSALYAKVATRAFFGTRPAGSDNSISKLPSLSENEVKGHTISVPKTSTSLICTVSVPNDLTVMDWPEYASSDVPSHAKTCEEHVRLSFDRRRFSPFRFFLFQIPTLGTSFNPSLLMQMAPLSPLSVGSG